MIPRPFCLSLKKTSLRTTPQGTPAGQGQLPWSSKHQVPTEDSILRPNLIWILFFSNTYIHIIYIYTCAGFPNSMSVFKPCQWRWSFIVSTRRLPHSWLPLQHSHPRPRWECQSCYQHLLPDQRAKTLTTGRVLQGPGVPPPFFWSSWTYHSQVFYGESQWFLLED